MEQFKKTLTSEEKSSYAVKLSEEEVSNYLSTLKSIRENKILFSKDEINNAIDQISEISRMQLEGKIYAFIIDNGYFRDVGYNACGVELYKKIGNELEQVKIRDTLEGEVSIKEAAKYLQSNNIKRIYTGKINGSFFHVKEKETDNIHVWEWSGLEDYDIQEFAQYKIEVLKLEDLYNF